MAITKILNIQESEGRNPASHLKIVASSIGIEVHKFSTEKQALNEP